MASRSRTRSWARGDDLVYLPGYISNVDLQWDVPPYARFLERLASFSRLILMDRRGAGCSDRLPPGQAATLEEQVSDLVAVMDTVGARRGATVFAEQESAFIDAPRGDPPSARLAARALLRLTELGVFR